jgi:tetratricopeptide (TPR) repeat protein
MEITQNFIEEKLKTFLSDEKRIEWLEKISEQIIDKELKKFCYLKIAELYEKKQMISSAINFYVLASSLVEKYKEGFSLALKIAQLYVKNFNFQYAEDFLRKALSYAPLSQKEEIEKKFYNFFIEEAKAYEEKKRFTKAVQFYKYLADKGINKIEMLNKIAELYDKAAMPLEASKIRGQIKFIKEREEEEKKEKEEKRRKEMSRADRLVFEI